MYALLDEMEALAAAVSPLPIDWSKAAGIKKIIEAHRNDWPEDTEFFAGLFRSWNIFWKKIPMFDSDGQLNC